MVKRHRYFPDFYVKVGKKKYIAEVKPSYQNERTKKLKSEILKKYISEVMTYAVKSSKSLKQRLSFERSRLGIYGSHRKGT